MKSVELLENEVKELVKLLEAFKHLNSNIEIREVLRNILYQMVHVVDAEAGTLWVVDKNDEYIVASAAYGPTAETILNVRMNMGEGIVGRVISTGNPELIEDVSKHPNWTRSVDENSGFTTKSMIIVPLIAKNKAIGALQLLNKKTTAFFTDRDINLAFSLATQSALALHNSQMYHDLSQMFLSMIKTLVKTLDARDPYTAGHSERVASYSLCIGKKLGLDGKTCDELYKAALLHDIGKIGIPDHILLKQSRLTDEEFNIIKQHTIIGSSILSNLEPKDSMKYAVQTARSHHEKMDGTGYPDGLEGDKIPFFARVVGVADAFDAMTTVRPYSQGRPVEKAAEELIRCKDTIFDAQIVDVFTAVLEEVNYQVETLIK